MLVWRHEALTRLEQFNSNHIFFLQWRIYTTRNHVHAIHAHQFCPTTIFHLSTIKIVLKVMMWIIFFIQDVNQRFLKFFPREKDIANLSLAYISTINLQRVHVSLSVEGPGSRYNCMVVWQNEPQNRESIDLRLTLQVQGPVSLSHWPDTINTMSATETTKLSKVAVVNSIDSNKGQKLLFLLVSIHYISSRCLGLINEFWV